MVNEMTRMYTVITGGCGYIGSHLVLEFLLQQKNVIILDNYSNSRLDISIFKKYLDSQKIPLHDSQLLFYNCDLRNKQETLDIFKQHKGQVDGVIHLAGLKAVQESVEYPLLYYQNNVIGTMNLLDALKEYSIKNIVFSSSATVYGETYFTPTHEGHKIAPMNPYGNTKAIIEKILMDAKSSFNSILLRYFNPVGNHSSGIIGDDPRVPNNLFPYIVNVVKKKQGYPFLPIYGNDYNTQDGTGVRDYIHVCDLVEAHIRALDYIQKRQLQNTATCDVFNIGTGKGYSVMEIVASMEKCFNTSIPYQISPERPGDTATVVADVQKAKRVLHWEANRTLEDITRDLYKFVNS